MQIAIYSRVSTDKQDAQNQLVQLREFATKQDWPIVAEYVDYASGAKSDRVQFQTMFRDASQRKFDLVLFWSLDRFTREGSYQTAHYLNQLDNWGVGFRSYTEQYLDSTGIFKEAVISILSTVAKQERIRISERTKAGLAIARAKGKTLGRPTKVNGQHRAEIARLRSAGLSGRAIARHLSISEGSVRRANRVATA